MAVRASAAQLLPEHAAAAGWNHRSISDWSQWPKIVEGSREMSVGASSAAWRGGLWPRKRRWRGSMRKGVFHGSVQGAMKTLATSNTHT